MIYASERATADETQAMRQAIEHGDLAALDSVLATIRRSGALERTHARAVSHAAAARAALATLPASPYRDALDALAVYAVERSA